MAPDKGGDIKVIKPSLEQNRSPSNQILKLEPDALDKIHLEDAFPQFVAELDLSPEKQKSLYEQPIEKKWLMLTEQSIIRNKFELGGLKSCAEFMNILNDQEKSFVETEEVLNNLESLSVALRTQSNSFVEKFITFGGVTSLRNILNDCRQLSGRDYYAAAVLSSFRALLNSTIGRSEVLISSDVLLAIASSQYFHYAKCKVLCLEILSGICLINDGHEKVLRALSEASAILGERTRFQTILNDLHRNYRSERETERVRTAAMSLINALLSTGSAENSVEVRMHLRVEMLMLGLQGVLDSMRESSSSILSDHIDFFEMSRQDDEQNFLRDEARSCSTPIDLDSAGDIAECIANRLTSTLALPHFLSMLQHLILIPTDEKNIHIWRLFDMILQHLSLQTTLNAVVAADLTQSVVQIDMNEILSRLRTQYDYDKLKEAHDDLEEELRRERNNSLELQTRLSDPDGQSLYSRLSGESFSPSDPSHSPRSLSLPPICPPIGAPPPPPPPTLDQLRTFGDGHATLRRNTLTKNVPKPSGPLKSLNWTAIDDNKIAGTIWEKIDEEKLYQQLDLVDLSENFSMAKGVIEEAESVSETLRRRSKGSSGSAISVIEPRRAQNCTIMLSKLRLTNKQIKKALLSMDQYDELPRDMLEQMLKFVPTKEEISRLRETVQKYGGSSSILAIADRFLYEVSNIPRYEQRLRCLFILTTFKERLDDVSTNIQAISNASTSVAGSKRFKSLLRLILAVGNYLNYGKRNGNASGFTLDSLCVLTDVRSSPRSDQNLLHYLIRIADEKFPEINRLKRDFCGVHEAARHSRAELEQELQSLRGCLAKVSEELRHREHSIAAQARTSEEEGTKTENGDRLVPVLSNFFATATKDFLDVDRQFKDMNTKFAECRRLFGDECSARSSDEFFGVLSKFVNSFTECMHQVWEERENIERIKKQTLARSIFAKKSRRRDNHQHDFDQLVNALQTGEIFSEELSRLRCSYRSRRKSKK